MRFGTPQTSGARSICRIFTIALLLIEFAPSLFAQQLPVAQVTPPTVQPVPPSAPLPNAPSAASITGSVTDTDAAAIPNAQVTLESVESGKTRTSTSDSAGAFTFPSVPPGKYVIRITTPGFASWKIKDIIVLHEGETFLVPTVELGVESIDTTVNAISMEDLAEQQITVEEHQRILGILPNFYVSYVPNAAPLTRKQKFKLASVVSRDPVTFFTTGVTAGIEQWQGDFSGYGQEFSGYAKRYAATYGDRLSSTFLGAALLPSLLHQDPRYFYRGHGRVIVRALYAISTVAVCKGDNGHWQPNFSNIGGNLGAAFISSLYYPSSDQHSAQVTVDNTLIGVATGAFGTLFQEFLLHRFTHGKPTQP
jgi:hypothetical protein